MYLAYHDKEGIPLSPGGAHFGTFVTRFIVLFLLFSLAKNVIKRGWEIILKVLRNTLYEYALGCSARPSEMLTRSEFYENARKKIKIRRCLKIKIKCQ